MPLELTPRQLATVQSILATHVPNLEVRAFGSRVQGTARRFSDLDLTIMGAEPLGIARLGELRQAFSESDLPMKVDVVDWATTSAVFQQEILRTCTVLQEARGVQMQEGK